MRHDKTDGSYSAYRAPHQGAFDPTASEAEAMAQEGQLTIRDKHITTSDWTPENELDEVADALFRQFGATAPYWGAESEVDENGIIRPETLKKVVVTSELPDGAIMGFSDKPAVHTPFFAVKETVAELMRDPTLKQKDIQRLTGLSKDVTHKRLGKEIKHRLAARWKALLAAYESGKVTRESVCEEMKAGRTTFFRRLQAYRETHLTTSSATAL